MDDSLTFEVTPESYQEWLKRTDLHNLFRRFNITVKTKSEEEVKSDPEDVVTFTPIPSLVRMASSKPKRPTRHDGRTISSLLVRDFRKLYLDPEMTKLESLSESRTAIKAELKRLDMTYGDVLREAVERYSENDEWYTPLESEDKDFIFKKAEDDLMNEARNGSNILLAVLIDKGCFDNLQAR